MTDSTTTHTPTAEDRETADTRGFNLDAGIAAAAQAETAEILNLLGEQEAGGSCCGGSCCSA